MQTTTHFSKLLLMLPMLIYLGACGESKSPSSRPQSQPAAPADTSKDKAPPAPAPEEKAKEAATVENLMPLVAPLDTFGGELLKEYLADTKSTEDTLVLLFKDYDRVRPTLAEMSMAIQQLKSEGQYGQPQEQKIHSFESALQQFLSDERVRKDNVSRYIDYGTAIAVGVLGGVYADRILAGLSRNVPKVVPAKVKDGLSRFGRRASAADVAAAKGTSNAVALRLSRETLSADEIVSRSMTEAIGSKALLEGGYQSRVLAGRELGSAKRMDYKKTPFANFDIAYKEGAEHFYARATTEGGETFFKISGEQAVLAAKDGKFVVVPPAATTNFLATKIKDFGKRTVSFVGSGGNKIVTAVSNPRASRWVQGTAFGAVTGGLTLLVLRSIDHDWVSLPEYVQSLSDQGVDVEHFLQTELHQSQAEANTLK